MSSAGFEPSIPKIKRTQIHAFDIATTGIGFTFPYSDFFLHKNRKWENILKLMAASFPFLYSALNLINIEKIIFNACNIYIYILHNIHVYYVHAQ